MAVSRSTNESRHHRAALVTRSSSGLPVAAATGRCGTAAKMPARSVTEPMNSRVSLGQRRGLGSGGQRRAQRVGHRPIGLAGRHAVQVAEDVDGYGGVVGEARIDAHPAYSTR